MGSTPCSSGYRGRFAPSPTGPLHFGSLVAATASYLQALTHDGEWLLRIEDLDPPREPAGAAKQIINSLAAHGFHWQGPVQWQSSHLDEYHTVAEQLLADGLAYNCQCSRRDIRRTAGRTGTAGTIYPGTCRDLNVGTSTSTLTALRLLTAHSIVEFNDILQGKISCDVDKSIGDFIIRRKDGLIAYNLAVVLDDARQGITEVVRGDDLLDITPAQIKLQQVLGLPTPTYMHVPVVINAEGKKLSKQHGASPIEEHQPGANLFAALQFLRQTPPAELAGEEPESIWAWATKHWLPKKLGQSDNKSQSGTNNPL